MPEQKIQLHTSLFLQIGQFLKTDQAFVASYGKDTGETSITLPSKCSQVSFSGIQR